MTTDSLMLNYKMEKRFLAVSETEEIDAFLTPWSIVHVASGGFAKREGRPRNGKNTTSKKRPLLRNFIPYLPQRR